MIKSGILDPTKVVRIALQNAASIPGLLLTTEGLVAELPEEEKAPRYPTPPGGDMYRAPQLNRDFKERLSAAPFFLYNRAGC